MRTFNKLIIAGSALFVLGHSNAFSKTVEFSADAVINIPHQSARHCRIFVGAQAVRREMSENGQKII